MSFFKRLFGSKLDGEALARSQDRAEYAQIGLLAQFADGMELDDSKRRQQWERVLPRPYGEQIDLFVDQGWLEQVNTSYGTTPSAEPYITIYQQRLTDARARVMPKVRDALAARDTAQALELRNTYEAGFPLGKAEWTGPKPQPSRSALTRRILYLDHWLVDGYSSDVAAWLKLYAAEQHLWGTSWRLAPEEIPDSVAAEVTAPELDTVEAVYWKAYQLALYVDNQETWQRCKGGDHVRRIEVVCMNDEYACPHCRAGHGQEYLVTRVPELPHKSCASTLGCRCRYEPVLESYEGLPA